MFDVAFAIAHPLKGEFTETTAIVDTGAGYSVLPSSFLTHLGIPVVGEREFTLADSSKRVYEIGEARFRIKGEERTSLVVFGDEGIFLLGAVALESFGLIADTTNRELIPAPTLYLL